MERNDGEPPASGVGSRTKGILRYSIHARSRMIHRNTDTMHTAVGWTKQTVSLLIEVIVYSIRAVDPSFDIIHAVRRNGRALNTKNRVRYQAMPWGREYQNFFQSTTIC